ncbi:MAG: AAA family ATPase [Gemmatimonadetes bacterium]|nr:AAA family ATPase [Gemmatimonadota bacterium]
MARTEDIDKQAEALDAARELALDRDFDGAEREIEPWLRQLEVDPDDRIRQADDPKAMKAAIGKARAIHDPASVVGLKPVSEFAGELPPPVLWMDARRGGGTILRVGDVALLSGAGGVGKSFVTLGLAVAAARGGDEKRGDGCGLHVRKGPAVVLSYEDDPRTVAYRCGLIVSSMPEPASAPEDLLLVPDPHPLMVADHENPGRVAKADQWTTLWNAIRSKNPSLVIVDPASAALAGVNQNDGATVRWFLRALAQEAKNGNFGVLVVAHSTKGARYGQADVGPHAVAGSAQWTDASRGVLFMRRQGEGRAVIECVKSNHGPVGWAVELEADMRGSEPGRFAGWKKRGRHSHKEWAERKEEQEREKKAKEKARAKAKKAKAKEKRKSRAKGNGDGGPPPPNVDDI